MPLFEVTAEELVPFKRVQAGPDLYENDIETLMWENLEEFTGEPLFRVARQAKTRTGGKPDIVALDVDGNVHVIEIKRDVDRSQLAQCLEYAGWAKNAGLDELAKLYHQGDEAFFADWVEFTSTESPRLVSGWPRLVLIARDIDRRTEDALDFLTDSDLPITVLRVTIYEDRGGRRFVDIDGDHEPDFESVVEVDAPGAGPVHLKIDGRRVTVSDLLDAKLLNTGQTLEWHRPRTDKLYKATVTSAGGLTLQDGRTFSSPSRAAIEAVGSGSYDGWHAWKSEKGELLHDLRKLLLASIASEGEPEEGGDEPVAGPEDDGADDPS